MTINVSYMSVGDALRAECPDMISKLEPVVREWVQEVAVVDLQSALFDFSTGDQSKIVLAA